MSQKKSSKISKEEREEFQKYFKLFDTDNDGEITGDEIEKMFQAAGFNMTKAELEGVLTTGDADKNRSINFEEYIELTESSKLSRDPATREKELIHAFKQFDTNDDGVIDANEFRKIMTLGGEKLDDIDALMKQFDTNGDGVLQYKEFVALWSV